MNRGDFHFVISVFESHESTSQKYVRAYTTIRKGQLLALIFSANSPGVLDEITKSIKTLAPLSHN